MNFKASQGNRTAASTQALEMPPRVLGRFGDPASGPTLIVIGAVHGNEPAGYEAMRKLFPLLEAEASSLRGSVVGLVGNRQALAAGVRFLEQDLNRIWVPEVVSRFERERDSESDSSAELAEARELYREFEDILTTAQGPVFALDIHSTSGLGPAFVVFDDTLSNRQYAQELEVPIVLGIEEELEGTLLDYLSARGARTAAFEAGQHADPGSVDRAGSAIWVAMRASGVLGRNFTVAVDQASGALAAAARGLDQLFEVRYRHAIPPSAAFKMLPGRRGFQAITKGEVVAEESGEPVRSPLSGLLLMPLYQSQGEDGYFVIRPVKSLWLWLSARLRPLRMERFVHWLPGVRRLDQQGSEIRVDLRIARWLPLDFFHLLGFRRIGQVGRHLFLRRRQDDGIVPVDAGIPAS